MQQKKSVIEIINVLSYLHKISAVNKNVKPIIIMEMEFQVIAKIDRHDAKFILIDIYWI